MGRALVIIDLQESMIPMLWTGPQLDATVRAAVSHGFDVQLVSDGHAPAANADPAGGLTPEQIIAHHNNILAAAIHPGGSVRLLQAKEVF